MGKIIKFIKKLLKSWNKYWRQSEKEEMKYRKWCLKNGVPYYGRFSDPFINNF